MFSLSFKLKVILRSKKWVKCLWLVHSASLDLLSSLVLDLHVSINLLKSWNTPNPWMNEVAPSHGSDNDKTSKSLSQSSIVPRPPASQSYMLTGQSASLPNENEGARSDARCVPKFSQHNFHWLSTNKVVFREFTIQRSYRMLSYLKLSWIFRKLWRIHL